MRVVPAELAERLAAVAARFSDDPATVRVAAVADATGIPRATLYYYFAGQQELLGWFLGALMTERAERIEKALAEPGTPSERLAAALLAQLSFIADHPRAYVALMGNANLVAGGLPNLAEGIQAAFHQPVRDLLEAGRRDGLFRNVSDAEVTASALFGAVTFAGLHYAVAGRRLDAAAVAAAVLPALLAGLG